MKKRYVSFEQWPYELAQMPEDCLDFAAHCCGTDADGEAHPLDTRSGNAPKVEPNRRHWDRPASKKESYQCRRRRKGALYARVCIGDATIEGWVVSVGSQNIVIQSKHTGKRVEMSREGVEFSKEMP